MFHLAASKGHANLAKFFHGKFFHKPELLVNASHDTPLHVSVKSNHYDFTKALLEVLKENSPKNKRNETKILCNSFDVSTLTFGDDHNGQSQQFSFDLPNSISV